MRCGICGSELTSGGCPSTWKHPQAWWSYPLWPVMPPMPPPVCTGAGRSPSMLTGTGGTGRCGICGQTVAVGPDGVCVTHAYQPTDLQRGLDDVRAGRVRTLDPAEIADPDAAAPSPVSVTREGAASCPKCGGAGWVWGYELDGGEDPPTDTRYSCDRCKGGGAEKGREGDAK